MNFEVHTVFDHNLVLCNVCALVYISVALDVAVSVHSSETVSLTNACYLRISYFNLKGFKTLGSRILIFM